ncbi:peptidase inhibitor family I36 protein [Streptomyces sp. NPDC057496]|uniref:peptidase inhibitor family I36 protein n=1 Tax=Streptomyces sp. NPDC057496 TaxID=3346149 RepID=UPI0036AA279B
MLGMGKPMRLVSVLAGAAAICALLPTSAQAAPSAWGDCDDGLVCVWTGDNGTGSRCEWRVDDADWQAGERVCSWSKTNKVASVYNNGTSGAPVAFFTGANWTGTRVTCTARGAYGNFSENSGTGFFLRSHTWSC